MNKTISINIGGFVFNIEEKAYQKLYKYLERIKQKLSEETDHDEIINDIELRIAELFQTRLSGSKEVIVDKDVEDIIAVMGQPEDYVSEESDTQKKSSSSDQTSSSENNEKRFFRDTENASIGGVCAGLSHYFNVDVTIVRILFILFALLGGAAILIYIILLFVIPEAKTTSDRMQMRGEPINVDSIKEHFRKIKDTVSDSAKSGKFKDVINQTVHKSSEFGGAAIRGISKILGFAFVIGGTFALILLFVVLFSNGGFFPVISSDSNESLSTLLGLFYPNGFQSSLVFISIMVVTIIPIISIIYSGLKILLRIKRSLKTVAVIATIIWFMGVTTLAITGTNLGMSMRASGELDIDVPLTDSSKTLLIDVLPDPIFSSNIKYDHVWNESELISLEGDEIHLGTPELFLNEKQDSGNFEIIIHKLANGATNKDAVQKCENISYPLQIVGNRLLLPAYYTIPRIDKIRGQIVQIEVMIPLGAKVVLGDHVDRIRFDFAGSNRYQNDAFANTTWISDGYRVICPDCKLSPRHHW